MLKKIKIIDYGTKLFEQELGTKLAIEVLENYNSTHSKTILDFEGVNAANTAFFNAFISKIMRSGQNEDNLSSVFQFENASDTILSIFVLTMQYVKFFKNEK